MELMETDRDEAPATAHSGHGCSRPIDLVYLARFTLGNRALEREVLQLFADQAPVYLDRMREAADDKAWAMASHTLKGSARAVGAWKVGAAAEAAEACKGPDCAEPRAAAMAKIEPLIVEAQRYIATLMVT